eukprot:CAMPEP_0113692478 /NCGR_PEP_ID=MMETSP0038_2-20120614/19102_1 /TAXON_ID=2898 /ORGANISM="Cryptomonas paramecium" /LENGTH=412 /DNA_ID=CAMNT_0000614385 /DNA_START=73 /DNA_END=1308 /DNA_ORIENTATION=+ /assembly_acc=CAM_ASM_000170
MASRFVVSFEPPHQILATEVGTDEFLGFYGDEIRGQSFTMFYGPNTDAPCVHSYIKNTASFKTSVVNLSFYQRNGHERTFRTTFSPFSNNTENIGACLIVLEPSENNVVESCNGARMLISSEWPNTIQSVNEEFTKIFGLSNFDLIGKSPRMIHGANTEEFRWRNLLEAANSGGNAKDILFFSNSSGSEFPCNVSCSPVSNNMNQPCGLFVLEFRGLADEVSSGLSSVVHGRLRDGPANHVPRIVSVPNDQCLKQPSCSAPTFIAQPLPQSVRAPTVQEVATPAPAQTPAAQPQKQGCGPAIFPRRKAGDDTAAPLAPVVVTREVLSTLTGMPLGRAAQSLGVSATALKKACRKLGLDRWAYKKNGGATMPDPARPVPVDESYVRRVYRKYAAAERSRPGVSRPASASEQLS